MPYNATVMSKQFKTIWKYITVGYVTEYKEVQTSQ